MADDLPRQLKNIGKGIVQINLRLNRLTDMMEQGSDSSKGDGPQYLDFLFDLLEVVEQVLAEPVPTGAAPVAPKDLKSSWWKKNNPSATASSTTMTSEAPSGFQGLSMERRRIVEQLHGLNINPISIEGPQDPHLHKVIEVVPSKIPRKNGQIAETHRRGWVRGANPPVVLRHAHVSVYQHQG